MNTNSPSGITTRNDIARDIIAGFAAVTPHLAGIWRIIDQALADLPIVLADLGPGTGRTRGGTAGPGEPTRGDPRDPRRRRRGRA